MTNKPHLEVPGMPPDIVGMKPSLPINIAGLHSSVDRAHSAKSATYLAACKTASDLAAARKKCRDLVDTVLKDSPEDAALLARALIEVGAAASRDLGDQLNTAFLLGHLSRRIREGAYIDF